MLFIVACNKENGSEKTTEVKPQKSVARNTDSVIGLIWSDRTVEKVNWFQAKEYCSNLEDSLWQLPTIDELRTLIQNCPNAELDGLCSVSEIENRLSSDNWSKDCFCKQNKNIKYSKLDDKIRLWALSEQTNNIDNAWYIFFSNANVGSDSKQNDYYARCVLKDSKKNLIVAHVKTNKKTENLSNSEVIASKNTFFGLQWSNKSAKKIGWREVSDELNDYCSNLKEGGYNDWRTPTFNEIRTLIIDCPNMEYNGECQYKPVSHNCGRYCDDGCRSNYEECKTCEADPNGDECETCVSKCSTKCEEVECNSTVNCYPCPKGNHSRLGDQEALWFYSNNEDSYHTATALDFKRAKIIFRDGSLYEEDDTLKIRCVRGQIK